MNKLRGKVAVVTGASKGIGASIAEHLAAEGASVIVNYSSSRSSAEAVVGRIRESGGNALAVQGDVSLVPDIQRLFMETRKAYGKVDILVNNAGTYEFATLEAITPEHVQKHFSLNVVGLIFTTQEAVKLIGTEGGSIVNIGSIVGAMPAPQASVYSASKAAVDAITVSLSQELGPRKIRVNSLDPGMVETDGLRASGLHEGPFREQQAGNSSKANRISGRHCAGRDLPCERRCSLDHWPSHCGCGRQTDVTISKEERILPTYYPPPEICGSNAGLAILDYSTKLAQYVHTPDA